MGSHRAGKRQSQQTTEDERTLQHKNDFIAFDTNQDNYVDASEVRALHKNLRQEDISAFFIASDANQDGLISLEEYLEASLTQD